MREEVTRGWMAEILSKYFVNQKEEFGNIGENELKLMMNCSVFILFVV